MSSSSRAGSVRPASRLRQPASALSTSCASSLASSMESLASVASAVSGAQTPRCRRPSQQPASRRASLVAAGDGGWRVGQRVWASGGRAGKLVYLGETRFAAGQWAGVVLDENGTGKNDGTVAGVRYFMCEPNSGIFCRPDALTLRDSASGGAMNGEVARRLSLVSPATPSSQQMAGAGVPPLNSRVLVPSTSGAARAGWLRYVGATDFAAGQWAGVELDEPSGKNDGCVGGRRYFSCRPLHGLFAPARKILPERQHQQQQQGGAGGSTPRLVRAPSSLSAAPASASALQQLRHRLQQQEEYVQQLLRERDAERTEIQQLQTASQQLRGQLADERQRVEELQFSAEEAQLARADLSEQLAAALAVDKSQHQTADGHEVPAIQPVQQVDEEVAKLRQQLLDRTNRLQTVEAADRAEIQLLRNELAAVSDQLKQAEVAASGLSRERDELREEAARAAADINEKVQRIMQLQTEGESRALSADSAERECRQLREQLEEVQFSLEELRLSTTDLPQQPPSEGATELLKHQLAESQQLLSGQEQLLHESSRTVEQLEEQLQQLKLEHAQEVTRLAGVREELGEKHAQEVSLIKEELEKVREQVGVSEAESSSLRTRIDSELVERSQLTALNEELVASRSELADRDQKITLLKRECELKCRQLEEEKTAMHVQRAGDEDTVRELERAGKESRSQLAFRERALEQAESARQCLQEVADNSRAEIVRVEAERDTLQAKLADVTNQWQGVSAERQRMGAELEEVRAKLADVTDQWQSVSAERQRMGAELEEVRAKLADVTDQWQGVSAERQRMGAELEEVRAKLADVTDQWQSVSAERQRMGAEMEEVRAKLADVTDQWHIVSAERQRMGLELEEVRRQLSAAEGERDGAETDRARSESALVEQLRTELSSEQERADTTLQQLQLVSRSREELLERQGVAESESEAREAELRRMEQSVADLTAELRTYRSSLLDKEQEMAEIKTRSQDEVDTINKNLQAMSDELATAKYTLNEKDEKIECMRSQLSSLQSVSAELETSRALLNEKNEEIVLLCRTREAAVEESRKLLDSSRAELEQFRSSVVAKDSQIETMRVHADEVERTVHELKASAELADKEAKLSLQQTEEHLQLMRDSEADLQRELLQCRQALSSCENQLKQLRDSAADHELQLTAARAESSSMREQLVRAGDSGRPAAKVRDVADTSDVDMEQQVDFLNTVIADLQRRNELLSLAAVEAAAAGGGSPAGNQMGAGREQLTEKPVAVRLWCDICEVFDAHDTEDCGVQSSSAAAEDGRGGERELTEERTHSRHNGRRAAVRPFCICCEMFGHLAADCDRNETY